MAERKPTRRREVGRGERVLPGVWRLRLPLPWPGVPHCNAWALAAGDGIVLVDTGMHDSGSMAHLERALDQAGLRLDLVRLVVCTHAHLDHCGQAPAIRERTGAEVWIHPDRAHFAALTDDPEQALARRVEVARQSGVPEAPLLRWAEQRRGSGSGMSGELVVDRDLVPGVVVHSDLGDWQVIETPGHAPSHVCLHQPERRLLISGDHLLGRVSPYFDQGHTPDAVGEFLDSLDKVDALGARLCLAGHGRPFTDVHGHVDANRAMVAERLEATRAALAESPATAFELTRRLAGGELEESAATWALSMTLAWLTHLERLGQASRSGGEPEVWSVGRASGS